MSREAGEVGDAAAVYAPQAKQDVPEGYKRTEVGVIPGDWEVSTVGAEFTIQLGKMLDSAKNLGEPKPYIGNRSVQWGRIDVKEINTVRLTLSDIRRFRLRRGDLLVCEGGEIGRAAIWDEPIPECYYQKALHRLRPARGYDVFLMMLYLEYWSTTGYLSNYVTQTSIAHLPKDKLEVIPLPRPRRTEQRAIATALSDVDALITALDRLIAKKRAIKTAAMQQLLTGKTRLPGFSGEWETKRLGELGMFLKGRNVNREEALSGSLPCVRYGELYTSHKDVIRDFCSWVSREVAEKATKLEKGDILFAGSGETKEEIGKCAAFVGEFEAYAGGDIVILRPDKGLDSTYLGYALNAPYVVRQKSARGQGDAVVHVSATALSDVEVHLPNLEEQTAIAQLLSDMDAEIAALEARRDKTRAIKQGMMHELLAGRTRLVEPETTEAA